MSLDDLPIVSPGCKHGEGFGMSFDIDRIAQQDVVAHENKKNVISQRLLLGKARI